MDSVHKISLIIPLRLTSGTYEGALRLRRLCATVPRDLYDIVISDYGTQPEFSAPIRDLEAEGIEVVRHPAPHRLFSIGHARDYGVQMARQPVVMFNDIDFLAPESTYRAIHAEVMDRAMAANRFEFFCVPVVFLTEDGSRDWLAQSGEGGTIIDEFSPEWAENAEALVQSVAFGSSAMVINRHHYLAMGGHDPRFSGHGGEDYDLLHRLAAVAPKGPRPHDYYTDYRDNKVRKYWGFRPFFALYGLDLFYRGLHLVHLWHPRRQEKGYFRAAQNFRLLRKVMRNFDRKGTQPLPLADLTAPNRMLVLYRTRRDLARIRELLPFSGGYELLRCRARPTPDALAAALRRINASTILLAPDFKVDDAELGALTAGADLAIIRLSPVSKSGTATVMVEHRSASGGRISVVLRSHLHPVVSVSGRLVLECWQGIDITLLGHLAATRPVAPHGLQAPIFESFGGPALADRKAHHRPGRRKKSPFLVRLRRRLSGF
jgi:predicted glycosyltransferase involved in capsule biosynthesis